jgi:hypothetical protein
MIASAAATPSRFAQRQRVERQPRRHRQRVRATGGRDLPPDRALDHRQLGHRPRRRDGRPRRDHHLIVGQRPARAELRGDRGGQLGGALEVRRVPGAGDQPQPRRRHGAADPLRRRDREQRIVEAPRHQQRERVRRVRRREPRGQPLGRHRGARRHHRLVAAALEPGGVAIDHRVGHRARPAQRDRQAARDRLAQRRVGRRRIRGVDAGGGRAEDRGERLGHLPAGPLVGVAEVGVLEHHPGERRRPGRGVGRDHRAAKRVADQHHPRGADRLDHRAHALGEAAQRVVVVAVARLAVARQVQRHHLEAGRDQRRHDRLPGLEPIEVAVHQHQRRRRRRVAADPVAQPVDLAICAGGGWRGARRRDRWTRGRRHRARTTGDEQPRDQRRASDHAPSYPPRPRRG